MARKKYFRNDGLMLKKLKKLLAAIKRRDELAANPKKTQAISTREPIFDLANGDMAIVLKKIEDLVAAKISAQQGDPASDIFFNPNFRMYIAAGIDWWFDNQILPLRLPGTIRNGGGFDLKGFDSFISNPTSNEPLRIVEVLLKWGQAWNTASFIAAFDAAGHPTFTDKCFDRTKASALPILSPDD